MPEHKTQKVKMRLVISIGARFFLLLYCAKLVVLEQSSSSSEQDLSGLDSDLDSDYHEDYSLDDLETNQGNTNNNNNNNIGGCEKGMFQCADK